MYEICEFFILARLLQKLEQAAVVLLQLVQLHAQRALCAPCQEGLIEVVLSAAEFSCEPVVLLDASRQLLL